MDKLSMLYIIRKDFLILFHTFAILNFRKTS